MLYPVELRAPVYSRFIPPIMRPPCPDVLSLVGVEGFEPPTSSSQSWRATRLRYTP
jgi:hypothetical protein